MHGAGLKPRGNRQPSDQQTNIESIIARLAPLKSKNCRSVSIVADIVRSIHMTAKISRKTAVLALHGTFVGGNATHSLSFPPPRL
jgi:hypothetical protein